MCAMKSFITNLLRPGSRLSALEVTVLNCVKGHLDARIAALWDSQVQAINKVQRLAGGVEVNFYRMKNGRPSFDDELAFPNKAQELPVGKVRLELPNMEAKLSAVVWCVKGFVFSIEYDGSVDYFDEAAGLNPCPEFRVSCELTADLTAAAR